MIDVILPERPRSSEPLDIDSDSSSIPSGARRDTVSSDTLIMGRGRSDVDVQSHNPSQHIQSFTMLQAPANRPARINPAQLANSVLLRYGQVQDAVFPLAQHLSLASDGFRVSTFDANYLCLGGLVGERYRVGWGLMVLT